LRATGISYSGGMSVIPLLLFAVLLAPAQGAQKKYTAPETFNARASVAAAQGRGDAYVTMRVERYSAPKDIKAMEDALTTGGSPGFGRALRLAPVVGNFEVGAQTFAIRWARQTETPTGRVVTLVVEKPVYFVGGGLPDAKPREGFDLAVIELTLDAAGLGEGRMAAAAKVKQGGKTGVEVDAYEGEPLKLASVMRKIS